MVKKRSSRVSEAELGDSWVNADSSSDETIDTSTTVRPSPRASRFSSRSSAEPATRTRARKTPASPEPEFIMPSIHEEPPPPRLPARKRVTASRRTPIRKAPSRHEAPTDAILRAMNTVFWWVLEVIGGAFSSMKTPLSYILAVYLLFAFMVFAKNLLVSNVYSALSPICRVPGVSMLGFDICQVPGGSRASSKDVHFNEVMASQSRFEDILDKTAEGVGLPADMKHSEASMRDLRTLVKYSRLSSKNELELELTGFVETARQASWDLQRFISHIGGASDAVLSTTRWTQRELESIQAKKDQQGMIAGFLSRTILAPVQPLRNTETALVDQYLTHMRIVKGHIGTLLHEGTAVLAVLGNIEDRLQIIHEIAVRDDVKANVQRDELLAQLWTMLGGNRAKLGSIDSQLKVLSRVNYYRKTATEQVSGTLSELKQMDSDLEVLHDRIGSAEGIKAGEIPLWQHIESLQLGAERLEERRMIQREHAVEHQRAVLDGRKQFDGDEEKVPEIEGR